MGRSWYHRNTLCRFNWERCGLRGVVHHILSFNSIFEIVKTCCVHFSPKTKCIWLQLTCLMFVSLTPEVIPSSPRWNQNSKISENFGFFWKFWNFLFFKNGFHHRLFLKFRTVWCVRKVRCRRVRRTQKHGIWSKSENFRGHQNDAFFDCYFFQSDFLLKFCPGFGSKLVSPKHAVSVQLREMWSPRCGPPHFKF